MDWFFELESVLRAVVLSGALSTLLVILAALCLWLELRTKREAWAEAGYENRILEEDAISFGGMALMFAGLWSITFFFCAIFVVEYLTGIPSHASVLALIGCAVLYAISSNCQRRCA